MENRIFQQKKQSSSYQPKSRTACGIYTAKTSDSSLPAKFKLARGCTSHVHATLVLLNWPFAFWTRFRISQYPSIQNSNISMISKKSTIIPLTVTSTIFTWLL